MENMKMNVVAAEESKRRKEKREITHGCSSRRQRQRRCLPMDVVFELCTRLPIKELFSCMSVSDAWRSMIVRDPGFSDAYNLHNPLIFVSVSEDLRFYYSSLKDEEFVQISTISESIYLSDTQMVNGLVCLYDTRYFVRDVSLHNIWTGEKMRLPDYPPCPVTSNESWGVFFGFDPVNNVYKLLQIYDNRFHILTIGVDSSWRVMYWRSKAPPSPVGQGFLADGVIYWRVQNTLCSFSLSQEKFRVIPIPQDDIPFLCPLTCFSAQFRGQFCLFVLKDPHKLTLLILQEDYSGEGCGYVWTMHETMLPSFLWPLRGALGRAFPVGHLPTGEILLADTYSGYSSTVVYSYNYEDGREEKSIFNRFSLGKLPDSVKFEHPYVNGCELSCFKPNFGALDSLIRA